MISCCRQAKAKLGSRQEDGFTAGRKWALGVWDGSRRKEDAMRWEGTAGADRNDGVWPVDGACKRSTPNAIVRTRRRVAGAPNGSPGNTAGSTVDFEDRDAVAPLFAVGLKLGVGLSHRLAERGLHGCLHAAPGTRCVSFRLAYHNDGVGDALLLQRALEEDVKVGCQDRFELPFLGQLRHADVVCVRLSLVEQPEEREEMLFEHQEVALHDLLGVAAHVPVVPDLLHDFAELGRRAREGRLQQIVHETPPGGTHCLIGQGRASPVVFDASGESGDACVR
eukprot:980246-Rhodomonas_salina.2